MSVPTGIYSGLQVAAGTGLQVSVTAGSANIPGSPGGPFQRLTNYTLVSSGVVASSTLYLDWNGQTFSVNTSVSPAAGYLRLATVVTGASSVTSVTNTATTIPGATASKRPYIYLPDGWDDLWRQQKAQAIAGTGIANVMFFGDSITSGWSASDAMTKGPVPLARSYLAGLGSIYGDYYNCRLNPNGLSGSDLPWQGGGNFSSGGGHSSIDTIQNSSAAAFGTTGDYSFTSLYACTKIDLIAYDPNSSNLTWQYNIDNTSGTGLTTVTTNGYNGTPFRISLTGLANTTHTIRFGNGSIAFACQQCGVITYTGAANGFFVSNNGFPGRTVADVIGGTQIGRFWQGSYKSSASTVVNTGFGLPCAPHLAFIEFGINDCTTGVPLDTYRLGIIDVINQFRTGQPNASIVLVAAPNPAPSSDAPTLFGNSQQYGTYVAELYKVAQAFGCALVDVHAKWGQNPFAQGFLTSGSAHPNDVGYADYANTLISIL